MASRSLSILSLLVVLLPLGCHSQTAAAPDAALRQGFAAPPADAKLRCYWWWVNGNTTEETITHDLTEMSRKGFGGVLLVDANGSSQNGNDNVPPGPLFGSPDWVRLYVHALKTAHDLHLEVTLNITSGWNLGGPDVKPERASKLLTWSRTQVDEKGFDGQLTMPAIKNNFYRQIAVLAYPLAHGPTLPGESGDRRTAIRALKFKAATAETGNSMQPSEALLEDVPATPGEEDASLQKIVDISAQVDAAGYLNWHPPSKGAWEVLRIGYTDSGAIVSTSSGAWQGLAIDYLDRGAFDTYWTHTVAPLLDASKPYLKTTLISLATDSWELGGTNWTGRFAEEFRKRRGYDPIPYLPIVAGRIVQDRVTSDRFLNDLRRTVADLVTDHYDHFAGRAKEYGLGTQSESGGPHGAPMDALETFRSSAVPQTEYWAESNEHRTTDGDRFFTKEAASAADIYGKKFAAQEGMTTIGPQWSESLATDLKPSFDRALTEGMNRLVWHEFTSSPASFGLPGNEYFAGTHLNPNVTWWQQGDAFFLYLNRAQFLMQQGRAVDDVLYFYGDEVPNFARLKHDDPAHILPGYDYDVTNEDALLHTLTIENGRIASPAGNTYRLLVLPAGRRLSLPALERIAAYVHQGGRIAGQPPIAPTGIVANYAAQRFATLTQALWGSCDQSPHLYGAGTVFCGADTRSALQQLKQPPDFVDDSGQLDYIHRVDRTTDIYFVRNTTAHAVSTLARFRMTGKTPELWNAITGNITEQRFYNTENGTTNLSIHLEPYGSTFVVFARPETLHVTHILKDGKQIDTASIGRDSKGEFALADVEAGSYHLHLSDGREVTTDVAPPTTNDLPASQWSISFQPNRGAPANSLPLHDLQSWSASSDPGTKYFSGTATYKTEINVKRKSDERVFVTLTDLHEICTVRINGKAAGTIWAMPYKLDITDSLADGSNTLELDVTNLWPNRIIGDAQPANSHAYTRTNIRKYNASSPLLPSGLIGPVAIESRQVTSIHLEQQAAAKH